MSLTIEVELKDIFTKIDRSLERMEQGQNDLKLSVSELKGQINTLDAKVDGLSTRVGILRTLRSWTFQSCGRSPTFWKKSGICL